MPERHLVTTPEDKESKTYRFREGGRWAAPDFRCVWNLCLCRKHVRFFGESQNEPWDTRQKPIQAPVSEIEARKPATLRMLTVLTTGESAPRRAQRQTGGSAPAKLRPRLVRRGSTLQSRPLAGCENETRAKRD
jgi:hypothetical protein